MAMGGGKTCCCFYVVAAVLFIAAAVAEGDGFITWDDVSIPSAAETASGGGGGGLGKAAAAARGRGLTTIVVSQDGTGHSRTVQGAVDHGARRQPPPRQDPRPPRHLQVVS
ncbi:hypothetical protein PR202_gb21586 [Eleusine coracana subsp. coracana]|uniref:Uncharacterized protein n=1 Tax=Eleusine coracana subsp. coracana TaxID=191504 RepID=A0AAV5FBH7_ELECO|nr:hypothetical protein PR202_gb21586 [Eleusine coracana subsp. coracana]